jgi:general nucleoside transport system ATP-binding protein
VTATGISAARAPSLDAVGMTKVFGPLLALDDVSIKVEAGSFHALLGENGAGKSTLVKCIMGFYAADKGQVMLGGKEVTIRSPRDARTHGIGMVYQHFTLVPCLSAAVSSTGARRRRRSRPSWSACLSAFRSTRR